MNINLYHILIVVAMILKLGKFGPLMIMKIGYKFLMKIMIVQYQIYMDGIIMQ